MVEERGRRITTTLPTLRVKLGGYLTLWAWKIAEARGLWELTDEAKRYQTW